MQTPTSNPYTVNELKQILGHTSQPSELETDTLLLPHFYQHLITESCFTFFTLTDYINLKYLFVSQMAEMVTGYPQQMFMKGGIQFMLSLVHPAEMELLRLIHQQMITFFNALPQSERLNYNYGYNVRIRKADNTYIHLFCQLSCQKLTNNGHLLLGKEMFTNITQHNQSDDMVLIISNQNKTSDNQDIIYHFNTPTSQHKLSAREKEVNEMVTRGLSSKEIGEMLSLSKHTIDTYRRKIRRKN